MPQWLIAVIASGAFATLLVWAFRWGRTGGNVNTRLDTLEKWVDDPPIRPECSAIFTEIKEGLANLDSKAANLDGKMDVVLQVIKEDQRNNEKKHINNKGKKGVDNG